MGNNQQVVGQPKAYSEEYKKIREQAERWPAWRVSTYNANFATSAHAKKLTFKQNAQ